MRGISLCRILLAFTVAVAALASGVLIAGAATAPKPREMKFACAKNSNGALRYVSRASKCKRTEKAITIADDAPIDVCVRARRTRSLPAGSTRSVDAATRCSSARSSKETALKVPGPKKLWFCALKTTGALRNVAGRSRCSKKTDIPVFVNKAKPVDTGTPVTPQGPPPNRAPVARPDGDSTGEDAPKAVAPLGNDSDPDGNVLAVASVDGTGTAGSVSLSPDGTIAYDPNGAFEDLAPGDTESDTFTYRATDGSAQSDPAIVVMTIEGANDAPEPHTSSGSAAYSEGDAPVAADPALTVADVDDTTLIGATVRVTGGFVANEDELSFTGQNGITGTYDSGTGVLTLTGIATVAKYQAALRTVKFQTAGDGPSPNPRAVEFRVRDADDQSAAVSRPLAVTGVNDAPFVNTSAGNAAYTENGAGTAVDPALDVGDPDSVNFNGARVAIGTGFSTPEDELLFSPQNGITGAYDSDTGVLTLTGQATRAQYRQALRSVRYANGSDHPSGATRTVSFQVSDQADLDSGTATRNVSVQPVNDAPVNTVPSGPTIDEGGSTNFGAGPDFEIADLDSAPDDLTTTVSAPDGDVAVLGPGVGTVQDNGASVQITGTVDEINERLVDVTYTPPTDADENRSVQIATNDGGKNGSGLTGIDTDSVTVAITAKNDPPVITKPANQTIAEDNPLTLTGISVADVDARSDAISATVAVSSGTLSIGLSTATKSTDDASSITLTGTVAQINDALDGMVYHPAQDATGDDTLTVTADDGGNNGDATVAGQTDSKSITITRTPVNDAPALTQPDDALDYSEDTPTADFAAAIAPNLGASDVDSANGSSATVKITGGYVSGQDVLSYSGSLSSALNGAGDTLTLSGAHSIGEYRDALRDVRYANTSEDPTAGTRTVEFKLTDSAGGESTGVTRTIDVTATNDAPTLDASPGSTAYTENDAATVVDGAITVSDVDSTTLTGATATISGGHHDPEDVLSATGGSGVTVTGYDSATGVLTLSGTASLSAYETALRSVKYRNTSDNPSGDTRTVSFRVNDGAGADNLSDVASHGVTVAPVNDAPTVLASAGATTFTEGAADAVVIDDGVSITDPDSTELSRVIVKLGDGFQQFEDQLTFVTNHGIEGSWNAANGELVLGKPGGGTAPIADFVAAAREVEFKTFSTAPGDSREILFLATDSASADSADVATARKQITIENVNNPPQITGVGSTLVYYTEDQPAVPVAGDAEVSDPDGPNDDMAGGTVTITTGFDPGDVLEFTNQGGVTGAYDAGVLTISGGGTQTEYRDFLRSVKFRTDDSPGSSGRNIQFQLDDGADDNNLGGAATSVDVTAVPDSPVVTTATGDTAYTEGAPAVTVDGGLTVVDADQPMTLSSGTVHIAGGFQSTDVLTWTDQGGVGGTYNDTTGTLSLGGAGTPAAYQAVMRSVKFSSTSDTPGASRTVEFSVDDGTGMSGASNVATKQIAITEVNDAPVLDQPDDALTYTEDDPSENHEDAVAPNLTLTDGDDANIESGAVTISIGSAGAEDELLFADQTGISGSGSGTDSLTLAGSATKADWQTALRSVTYRNTSDDPSEGTRTVSFQVDDGDATSNTVSRDIDVVATNDVPVADDETFNGADRAVGNTDLLVDDPSDDPPAASGPHKLVTGDILAGDTDADDSPTVVPAIDEPTDDGGTVTIEADGDFTFHPAAGCADHEDSFDYEATDGQATDTGTVTIEVQDCVWYVDENASGDGTSDGPFASVASLNGDPLDDNSDDDGPGDTLYLEPGTNAYDGGLRLEDDQRLHTRRHGLTMPDGGTGTVMLEAADSGADVELDGGLVLADDNDVQGLDLGATPAPTPPDATLFALSGTAVGTAHVNDATPGAIDNPTGGAIKIDGTLTGGATSDVDIAMTGVDSSGSDSEAISLTNVDGTVDLGGGTLSSAGPTTVVLSGGDGDFTLDADIIDGAGRLVDVHNKTGGLNEFNGLLDDGSGATPGGGISVQGNSAETETTTATVTRFDGGMHLNTGPNPGVVSSGGGELAITDPASDSNTIDTTTGTPLNLAFTTIRPDGLTFEKISSTGAANGITLNHTGSAGGLTVTGVTADGSGGTISSSLAAGIVLDTVGGGVTLSHMSVTSGGNDGVRLFDVDGFTMSDSSVNTNGNATGERGFDITNSRNVSLARVNAANNRDDGVRIDADGTHTASATVTDSVITAANTPGVGDAIDVQQTGSAELRATLEGNSLSTPVGSGIRVGSDGLGSVRALVTGNAVGGSPSFAQFGMLFNQNDASRLDATVQGNTISGAPSGAQAGLRATGNTDGTICLDAGDPTDAGLKNSLTGAHGSGHSDIEVAQQSQSTFILPGYAGGISETAAVEAYLQGRNDPVSTPTASATSALPPGYVDGTCLLP